METVESKISGLYIGLVIFLHFAILIIILISSTFLRDIFNLEKRIIAGVVIIAMLISFILLWQEILSAKKVVVDLNGIKIFNAKSVREITFSEIDKIQKGKVKTMMMKGVPFSEGYTYSEIILKQGKSVIISPDKYDNYLEIMVFINNQIDKHQLSL
jgi:hypothetical protein